MVESAQGSLICFVAGFHFVLLAGGRRRIWIAGGFVLMGLVWSAGILHKLHQKSGDYSLGGVDLLHLPAYGLMPTGGVFGLRDAMALPAFGLLTFGMLALLAVLTFRTGRWDRPECIAVTTVLASALFAGSFAVGRSKFGIAWAVWTFHAAPLFAPLLIGMAIQSLRVMSVRPVTWIPLAFVLGSIVPAMPYGAGFADDWLMEHGLAMRAVCDEGPADPLGLAASGLTGHQAELTEAMPVPCRMCSDGPHGRAARMLVYPAEFQARSSAPGVPASA